ncbi:MAG: DNA replication/repair protein RecF [Rhodanobacteraceae bacterium]
MSSCRCAFDFQAVRLSELRIENLRLFQNLELTLGPGWSVFIGPNGTGKTSLLEAVYLLSHGRSFRSASRTALIGNHGPGYAVYAKLERGCCASVGLGLARRGNRMDVRIDGQTRSLSDLVKHCAVACFEPGSHALIAGFSEERRRFLDWGVFHVEPEFLPVWRRCQRALKQRNAAIRHYGGTAEIDVWDQEIVLAATALTKHRCDYFEALRPVLNEALRALLPELGQPVLRFDRGWDPNMPLLDVLKASRESDLVRGFTKRGPHRADWSIGFDRAPRREHLSRGQEKLCALACILAQARLHAARTGEWPILCLDDLASELDASRQVSVLNELATCPVQVLMTGTSEPVGLDAIDAPMARFHVEPGSAHALL